MAEIKSALELALEKAERYGKASQEEMAAAHYQEQGRQLAVRFLREEGDLESGLKSLSSQAQEVARLAIKEVFLRNIGLPREEIADPRQARALEGLGLVAGSPKAMARLNAELDQLLNNYLQIRSNALQQLKVRFAAGIGQMQRQLEAQMRQKVRLEVEHLPQFQEEWRRFQGQLLEQFEPMLEEIKAKMRRA